MARIMNAWDPEAVRLAAEIIRRGGLVAFPTETVYGLGADAANAMAAARIFEVKQRPSFDPLIVHVGSVEDAHHHGRLEDERARALMNRFWPGPLTLVVPKRASVPPIVTAGLETVALRMPAHEVALALIRESKKAIAAPSANTFGYVSPTEASHVAQDLSGKIDLILDGGKCSLGVESTIISLAGANPVLLRPGATPVEEIEDVAGKLERHTPRPDRPQAPGELARHYATRTPLDLVSGREAELSIHPGEKVGILALRPPSHPERYAATEVLSHSGNLREAAANLFSSLRRLDDMGLDRLVAFPVPETGLGIAIMDRLRRCARGV